MSSFTAHVENINELRDIGVDVSDYINENGEVSLESWHYDELTYLMSDVIDSLKSEKAINFQVTEENAKLRNQMQRICEFLGNDRLVTTGLTLEIGRAQLLLNERANNDGCE